jgi:hypothetical protein
MQHLVLLYDARAVMDQWRRGSVVVVRWWRLWSCKGCKASELKGEETTSPPYQNMRLSARLSQGNTPLFSARAGGIQDLKCLLSTGSSVSPGSTPADDSQSGRCPCMGMVFPTIENWRVCLRHTACVQLCYWPTRLFDRG